MGKAEHQSVRFSERCSMRTEKAQKVADNPLAYEYSYSWRGASHPAR